MKKLYESDQRIFNETLVEKCRMEAEKHQSNVCDFAMAGTHCYLNKVRFEFKM